MVYSAINQFLLEENIRTPRLLSENYKKNFIEIEDFGDQTIYKTFKNKKINQFLIFKKIIFLLKKIQLIKDKKIKNFKNKEYLIPNYNAKILLDEAKLFSNWYTYKKLSKKKYLNFKKEYEKIV